MGRKLKSRANCSACFLSMPLTAQCSWLCLSLFLSVLTSLACSDCLFLSGEERRWEKGGNEEEASFHSDCWWKGTRQVLLGCTPLFFLPFPLCFSKMPHSHSVFLNTSLHFKSAHHWFSPASIPTSAGCFPVLLSEFLLIIQMFVSHPFKEEKQTHKSKGGNQQWISPFTLFFFPPNWPYPHSIHICPPPHTFSILSRSHNHLGDHFSSASLFKTLFPLSITWRLFRSVAWSNAPQRCTWNRGHAQLIHHFPPTIASPLPQSHPPL